MATLITMLVIMVVGSMAVVGLFYGALALDNATFAAQVKVSSYVKGIMVTNPARRMARKGNYEITLAECYSLTPNNRRSVQVCNLFLDVCKSKGYTINNLDKMEDFLADQIRDAHRRVYGSIIL